MLQWPTASSLFPYTTLFRSVGPQLVRELGRRPHGELAVRELALVVAAKLRGDTARLHGHRHDALVDDARADHRSEEHTSELQSHSDLVCRLLLEKKKLNSLA